MKTRIFTKNESILNLTVIIKSWINECKVNDFGMRLDLEEIFIDFHSLIHAGHKDLLILENDEGKIVGMMGLIFFKSPIGLQWFANEHYWYILPEYRGNGMKLIKQAREWAKKNKCSHLILNASMMASDVHNKVCSIYEKIGMKKFETNYIERIGD